MPCLRTVARGRRPPVGRGRLALHILTLLAGLLLAPSASADPSLRILPLGDSRVEGSWPDHASYRASLWTILTTRGLDVDFIGPLHDDTDHPSRPGAGFDRDHAGIGGFTTDDILDHLSDALADTGPPEIVLLGIGGNDLLERTRAPDTIVGNVARIIDLLRRANPEVIILVDQIAPGRADMMSPSLTRELNAFNSGIESLAAAQSTEASPVLAVDMATGWSDRFLADDVHYSIAGAERVAKRYADALLTVLD